MHAQVYEHHARIVADQMFLKALYLDIEKENILDKKALQTSKQSTHKKFLDYYLGLDDRSIYDQILEKRDSDAAKIIQAIKNRKLLKRACDFHLGPMMDAEVAKKIEKMETHEIEKEVAEANNMDQNDIIVHLSKITIKLYDKRDILVLWKGRPIDLNDLSPIRSDSVVERFLVFGPPKKNILKKIKKSVATYLNVPINEL